MTLALCLFFARRLRRSAHKKEQRHARPYSDPTLSLLDRTKSQFSVKVKLRRSAAYELLRDLELPRKLKQSQCLHARNGTQSEILPLTTEHVTVPPIPSISQTVPPMPSETVIDIANTGNPPSRRHTRQRSYAFSRSSPPPYDELFSVTVYGDEAPVPSESDGSPRLSDTRQNMVSRWVRRMSRGLFGSLPGEQSVSSCA